jgi:hypothetical protein
MATRFAQQFARAAVPNLVRQFGDTIIYMPRHGPARSGIAAMIERNVEVMSEADGFVVHAMVLRVVNDSTTGISAAEIDQGGDQIKVPLRVGEPAVTRTIVQVISTENGLVRFAVE